MSRNVHRQWGERDILFYCPENKVVWQYDRTRKVHIFPDMPTYGLNRRKLPNG